MYIYKKNKKDEGNERFESKRLAIFKKRERERASVLAYVCRGVGGGVGEPQQTRFVDQLKILSRHLP